MRFKFSAMPDKAPSRAAALTLPIDLTEGGSELTRARVERLK